MFPEANPKGANSYFYPNNAAPQTGKLSTAPDYSNTIAKPTYRQDIDFSAEASTPEVNRSFINQIITESGGLPEMAPKMSPAKGKKA